MTEEKTKPLELKGVGWCKYEDKNCTFCGIEECCTAADSLDELCPHRQKDPEDKSLYPEVRQEEQFKKDVKDMMKDRPMTLTYPGHHEVEVDDGTTANDNITVADSSTGGDIPNQDYVYVPPPCWRQDIAGCQHRDPDTRQCNYGGGCAFIYFEEGKVYPVPGVVTITTSEENRDYGTGAQRDQNKDKGRFDLLPPLALQRVARIYQKGAEIRGRNNWRRGMPLADLIDSGIRHCFMYLKKRLFNVQDDPEDHLAMAVWNLLGAMETEELIAQGKLPQELDTVLGDLDEDWKF